MLLNNRKYLRNNYYIVLSSFLLLLISIFVLFVNYVPSSRLIGWDNHQSELFLLMNIKRSLSSSWTEWAGLGVNKGMAMEAELPKQILSIILSFFVENSDIRFVYTGIMYILGPIGVNFLFTYLSRSKKSHKNIKYWAIFLGSLFYLLNIHTVQIFRIPLEMFIAFYCGLPWILFFLFRLIDKPSTISFLLLVIVSFFFSTSFINPTNFLVFGAIFILLGIGYSFGRKNSERILIRVKYLIIGGLGILIANLYWLTNFLFFFINNKDNVTNSKISELISENFTRQMLGYGTFHNFIMMKNFYFGINDVASETTISIMGPWLEHLSKGYIIFIAYVLFVIILFGLIYSIYKRKCLGLSFFLLFLFCFIAYFILNPPTGVIYNRFVSNSILLKEAFRSPYTKFSTPLILTLSYYFYKGNQAILRSISNAISSKLLNYIIPILVVFFIFTVNSPTFEGELIFSEIQQKIPVEYNNFFEFMKNIDSTDRILVLPAESYAGWRYYKWGYRGSGFIWYGVEQPVIDRAFDIWSPYNETIYNEISLAVNNADLVLFNNILNKYNLSYIMLDKNLSEDTNQVEKFLLNNPNLEKIKSFNEILIFQNKSSQLVPNNIGHYSSYNNILPKSEYLSLDKAINEISLPYISSEKHPINKYYLYRNLERDIKKKYIINKNSIEIDGSASNVSGQLNIPEYFNKKIPYNFNIQENNLKVFYKPSTLVVGEKSINIGNDFASNLLIRTDYDYLRLNNYSPVLLSDIRATYSFLGDPKENIYVSFYKKNNVDKTTTIDEILNKRLLIECEENNEYSSKKINSLEYTYSEAPLCEYIIMDSFDENILAEIIIDYHSSDDFAFDYCVNSDGTNCVNRYPNVREGNHQLSELVSLEASKQYYLTLNFYGGDTDKKRRVTINNLRIRYLKPVKEHRIKSSNVINKNTSLQVSNLGKYSFKFPKYEDINSLYIDNQISRSEVNIINRGSDFSFDKIINRQAIEYKLKDGKIHDLVSLNNLNQNSGYMICTSTKSKYNRELKIYLNKDNKNIIEKWSGTCFYKFVEPSSVYSGYRIYLEGESYNNFDKLDLSVENFSIYNMPYEFLKELQLNGEKREVNPVRNKLINMKSYIGSIKKITLDNPSDGELLVNYTGFDENWIMYTRGKVYKPVLVNNWATGWILNEDANTVYLIYFPQLVQWIAYLILLETLIVCSIIVLRKKKLEN